MLRWSAGVTLLEKIKNQNVRGSFRVVPIANKGKEERLRRYGHVRRSQEDLRKLHKIVKLVLNLPTSKRACGRPPATWLTTIDKDLKESHLDKDSLSEKTRYSIALKGKIGRESPTTNSNKESQHCCATRGRKSGAEQLLYFV
ncbi:hypothetical protein EVAR_62112_1 [Eumeta japonica]|uniref:Uncharacterized protein n=1 Tax=Eumeta variegata TaxID=151549 RepID=A0A4C1Z6C1_EUMVA|nr:hypothetical protein EVAR_62112_1 [Eumeta japonica]